MSQNITSIKIYLLFTEIEIFRYLKLVRVKCIPFLIGVTFHPFSLLKLLVVSVPLLSSVSTDQLITFPASSEHFDAQKFKHIIV